MVFERIISRFPGRRSISGQPHRLSSLISNQPINQSPESLSRFGQKRDLFSGISKNYQDPTRVLHNPIPRFLGNLGMKLGLSQQNSLPASLKFANSIHSVGPKEFERRVDDNFGYFNRSNQNLDEINRSRPTFEPAPARNFGLPESLTRKFADLDRFRGPNETGRDVSPLGRSFGPSAIGRNMYASGGFMRDNENYRPGLEQNADIVHVKIMRNNTFVTVTDYKGDKKLGTSAGALAEMKGGPKVSKYSAEATAEHIGREAKRMGLKSVVVKVNGFTFFKKKKLAILSFRDGYTNSRSDRNPIVYIEDTTRKPHNGCRRKKQRRV